MELDIVPWFPYGVDYSPVTVNNMAEPLLASVSGLALELNSEFLYLRSFQSGNVGTLARQNMIDPFRNKGIEFGFTMILTFSEEMERCILALLSRFSNLRAALTLCSIWNDGVLVDECKVILLISDDLFFDEKGFISTLNKALQHFSGKKKSNMSFFAEKFGYRRFSISYETDDIMSMRISQALFDFELDSTREVVGPAPELLLPATMTDMTSEK
ncbi:MAG: hypothetical protein RR272_04430 [Synergistaceae bacterium]